MFCVGYFPGTTRHGCWNHRMHQEWQKKYYRMLRLGERATRIPKPRQAWKHGWKTHKTYFAPYHSCAAWKFCQVNSCEFSYCRYTTHLLRKGTWRQDDFIFFGSSKVYFCPQNMDSSKDSMKHEDFQARRWWCMVRFTVFGACWRPSCFDLRWKRGQEWKTQDAIQFSVFLY